MAGYVKNPAATADCIDGEGYFHTGDVCVVDDKGNYAIVDRIKELIKYKGFQVRKKVVPLEEKVNLKLILLPLSLFFRFRFHQQNWKALS